MVLNPNQELHLLSHSINRDYFDQEFLPLYSDLDIPILLQQVSNAE